MYSLFRQHLASLSFVLRLNNQVEIGCAPEHSQVTEVKKNN